ncbi:hypothetical protein ATI53_106513 [Salipiger aestuarii]|uniref:4-amino-4-deoxy-L-arabinose transferase-like glycosyltransferase n=1 Tax=Salipiger aestuarii TaxID=568098 RepID=A0A327XLY1_9RHOB|nr:hypothetical protein [Salipiger aestuarii]RAK09870.1 hypothetical protein ATI53_106513 [Salipiger aestuarii]
MSQTRTPLCHDRLRWIPVAVFIYLCAITISKITGLPEFLVGMTNDSAMRLVEVRDLLNGQPWFDLDQTRLGLEGGFEMHWSRLIDAPIAGLILLLDLFTSRARAEYLVIVAWPLIMLGLVMWLVGRIAATLHGPRAAPLAAALSGFMMLQEARFLPGAIDHHNVQIVLLLVTMLGVLGRHDSRALPAGAGAALAASLAIGVETLPLLAVCTFGMVGFWLARGTPERAATLRFAGGGIGGLAVLFPATAPASAYAGGFCDALSVDLALPAALGLGAMAACAYAVSGRALAVRAGILAALFAAVGAFALAVMPSCLHNPLESLDPYLVDRWLTFVTEARSLGDLIAGPAMPYLFGYYALGLAAMTIAAGFAWARKSGDWLLMTVLLAGALTITIYQLRGAPALLAISAPVLGVLVTRLHEDWRARRRPAAGIGAIACCVLAMPMTWGEFSNGASAVLSRVAGPAEAALAPRKDRRACFTPQSLSALAALPTGVVSAPSNFGAQILLHSDHRTLSGPYHRNQSGMRRQLEITMAATPEAAKALLVDTGIDYVVLCPDDPELATLHRHGFTGFGHLLETGERPDFLTRVPHGDANSGLMILAMRQADSGARAPDE